MGPSDDWTFATNLQWTIGGLDVWTTEHKDMGEGIIESYLNKFARDDIGIDFQRCTS